MFAGPPSNYIMKKTNALLKSLTNRHGKPTLLIRKLENEYKRIFKIQVSKNDGRACFRLEHRPKDLFNTTTEVQCSFSFGVDELSKLQASLCIYCVRHSFSRQLSL